MKTLKNVKPTPEQLKLITLFKPGTRVIRGAAGSGKTTTSILMLKTALGYLIDYKRETSRQEPIKVKIFSFNRTLSAYVSDLVDDITDQSFIASGELQLDVTTLAKYLLQKLPQEKQLIKDDVKDYVLRQNLHTIDLPNHFILDEVEYLLGRVDINNLDEYLTIERTGRGTKPRVSQGHRKQIIDNVLIPYQQFKSSKNLVDWNDLAYFASRNILDEFDIVIIDEGQDFSANQLKAILNQTTSDSFITIVLDSAQQIYKRGFTWKELGVTKPVYFRLDRNYRNTYEIANFATGMLKSTEVKLDDDATLPQIDEIERHGNLPIVVKGKFSSQLSYALDYIQQNIDLTTSSVCFLHPKGGRWFKYVKGVLNRESIEYVELTRRDFWPSCEVNVALSTIHSAKGLEFDYVIMLGIEDNHFIFEDNDTEDSNFVSSIKLISMAITRAKENVIIGYKADTKPQFIEYLDSNSMWR